MNRLVQGYSKFRQEVYPGEKSLFSRLKSGQSPNTLIICCSDSRVDLNHVTQSKPGDIFYVRNAGNLVPAAEAPDCGSTGAIEFAVETLPIRDVVVCGHSDCGAMMALRSGVAEDDESIVARWLRLAAAQTPDASSRDLDDLIRTNVVRQLDSLRRHAFVAERLAKGDLQLWGWVYDIATSQILQLEASSGRFLPLESVDANHGADRNGRPQSNSP